MGLLGTGIYLQSPGQSTTGEGFLFYVSQEDGAFGEIPGVGRSLV